MSKYIVLVGSMLVAGSVLADGVVNAHVQDHYSIMQTPQVTSRVCQDVQVRRESHAGPNGGSVLLGAIVGNAIGAATGIGDARTLGTIIGGVAGAEMSRDGNVSTYQTEQRCYNEVTEPSRQIRQYNYSTINFQMNGIPYSIRFNK